MSERTSLAATFFSIILSGAEEGLCKFQIRSRNVLTHFLYRSSKKSCGISAIVDDEGRPVGILTDRDVARVSPSVLGQVSAEEYNELFETTGVNSAMTKVAATTFQP